MNPGMAPGGKEQKTINFLLSNNMASLDENANCFLPEVAKCTGSEAYSTERSRRCRENKKRCIETDTQQDTTDMQQDATGRNGLQRRRGGKYQ